jgi:hypothetical protein
MKKNIILGSLMLTLLVGVSPVSADGGMNPSITTPAPAAEVVTITTFDMLINQIVSEVLQIFTWTNDDGAISFTDTDYSVQYDCNTLFGMYEVDRLAVDFSTPASTRMACEDDAMDADQKLAQDLSAITQLTFKDGMLVMTGSDTELIFTASLVPENDEVVADETEVTDYVGMTVTEAEAAAGANGVAFRVGTIDGEAQAVTADYVIGRITAEIEDDVVVAFTVEN